MDKYLKVLKELGCNIDMTCMHGAYHIFDKNGRGKIQIYAPSSDDGYSIGWCVNEWEWHYPKNVSEFKNTIIKAKKLFNIE